MLFVGRMVVQKGPDILGAFDPGGSLKYYLANQIRLLRATVI